MSGFKSNLPEDIRLDQQWTPIQSERQRQENVKRNKERWAQYDEEYRKAWSEQESKKWKEWWDNLSPEDRADQVAKRQEWWDSKDEAFRKEHGAKSVVWRQDAEKVLAYKQKKIESGQWRDPEIYKEIYYKTLSYKRYNGSGLYKKLAEEYNIPYQTLYHIGCNVTGLIDASEHDQNIQKIQQEWEDIKSIREEELAEQRKTGKFWFNWEIISPGKGSEELYDYYNSKRTANQKMPVKPSLVYYFREKGMKAKEIKEYCKENNIYESDDHTYWHKLAKFIYPWYSTNESVIHKFDNTNDAVEFASKVFERTCTNQWLHGKEKSGLQKFGPAKGWIIRKTRKIENEE